MKIQKTVAAIHDISGLGKCSLTSAIPVLSSSGVSVGVLPTAVLSTQTGGLNNYTYRDLTDDMPLIINHWMNIGVNFDAIYSGFLGSSKQVDIVIDFVKKFKKDNSIFLCDPAMADNGKLYNTFNNDFVEQMKRLCKSADIIVPNVTEAAFLLDLEYVTSPYSKNYVECIVRQLSDTFCVKNVVLTGVDLGDGKIGAAAYNKDKDVVTFSLREKIVGMFHSTGDLFASSLLGAILNDKSIDEACDIAIDFTVSSILKTVENGGDSRFGLSFELCLPLYMKRLGIINGET